MTLANNPYVINMLDNLSTLWDGVTYWVGEGGPQAVGDWWDDVQGPGSSSGGTFKEAVDDYNYYNSGSEDASDDLGNAIGGGF